MSHSTPQHALTLCVYVDAHIVSKRTQIPATPRNRRREDCSNENLRRGGSAGECSAVTVGAEGISQARGLLTGLSVPPELVQAVLEGVFWCR